MTEKVTEPKGAMEIRDMIDQRLKARAAVELAAPADAHLDEDAISAFIEGRLVEAESAPLISHLIVCASCRHATALLLRVESQFKPEDDPTPDESPGRVGPLLERLAAGFTPPLEEDAVFAYQEPEPDQNAESVGEEPPEKPEDGK
ncbi:MAG: hypothetical protein QOH41_4233 [Blastocatellia bacterium]|nr:hypothetical protein [Blastocatellia bacterium]